jgi:hypothetical protein
MQLAKGIKRGRFTAEVKFYFSLRRKRRSQCKNYSPERSVLGEVNAVFFRVEDVVVAKSLLKKPPSPGAHDEALDHARAALKVINSKRPLGEPRKCGRFMRVLPTVHPVPPEKHSLHELQSQARPFVEFAKRAYYSAYTLCKGDDEFALKECQDKYGEALPLSSADVAGQVYYVDVTLSRYQAPRKNATTRLMEPHTVYFTNLGEIHDIATVDDDTGDPTSYLPDVTFRFISPKRLKCVPRGRRARCYIRYLDKPTPDDELVLWYNSRLQEQYIPSGFDGTPQGFDFELRVEVPAMRVSGTEAAMASLRQQGYLRDMMRARVYFGVASIEGAGSPWMRISGAYLGQMIYNYNRSDVQLTVAQTDMKIDNCDRDDAVVKFVLSRPQPLGIPHGGVVTSSEEFHVFRETGKLLTEQPPTGPILVSCRGASQYDIEVVRELYRDLMGRVGGCRQALLLAGTEPTIRTKWAISASGEKRGDISVRFEEPGVNLGRQYKSCAERSLRRAVFFGSGEDHHVSCVLKIVSSLPDSWRAVAVEDEAPKENPARSSAALQSDVNAIRKIGNTEDLNAYYNLDIGQLGITRRGKDSYEKSVKRKRDTRDRLVAQLTVGFDAASEHERAKILCVAADVHFDFAQKWMNTPIPSSIPGYKLTPQDKNHLTEKLLSAPEFSSALAASSTAYTQCLESARAAGIADSYTHHVTDRLASINSMTDRVAEALR